jgi:uncharacterized NAD(P)/FAD-binding protein YdhS
MKQESPQQLQLELPDYRQEYERWLQKQEAQQEAQETVVIIDIY